MGRSKKPTGKRTAGKGAAGVRGKVAASPTTKKQKQNPKKPASGDGASGSAAPVQYKVEVKDGWKSVAKKDRTVEKAVEVCIKAYPKASLLVASDVYVGFREMGKPGEVLKQVSNAALDLHKHRMELEGHPIDEETVNIAFSPEYATNVSWRDGTLQLVTIKYLGMQLLPAQEMHLDFFDKDEISDDFVEFMWNVLDLKLRDIISILEFVRVKVDKKFRSFLLDDEAVETLTTKGTHEDFTEDGIEDTLEVLRGITSTMKKAFGIKEKPTSEDATEKDAMEKDDDATQTE